MGLSEKKKVEPKPKIPTWIDGDLRPSRPFVGDIILPMISDDDPRLKIDEIGRTSEHIFEQLFSDRIDAETLRERVIARQDRINIIGAYIKGHFDRALQRAIEEGRVLKDGELYQRSNKPNHMK